MAGSPARRPIRRPLPDLAQQELPRTRQAARDWFRIHPKRYGAVFFSLNPTHRYSHPNCPDPILYVGIDVETCLWECFGDYAFNNAHSLPLTAWEDLTASTISVPALDVCDLANETARAALTVDLSALMNPDITVPQEWGLAIQTHPSQVAGIKFRSRFSNKACLALFDRSGLKSRLQERPLADLSTCNAALDWLTRHEVTLV
jgi:hypothetical protein